MDFEVILVVDQSEDLVVSIESYLSSKAKKLNAKVLINKGKLGVNICRNIGIRASRGEIIGIVDDDTILTPIWVERTIANYQTDVALIGLTGPAIPLWEDPARMSWFPEALNFVWGCTVWDWKEKQEIRNVGGMNCSFRKEAILKAGLYDEEIGPRGGEERIEWFYPSGEEVEISMRIRRAWKDAKLVYDPLISVFHKAEKSRFNIPFIFKRTFRFGYTKRYIEWRFSDFPNADILQPEKDHARTILLSSIRNFLFEFPASPKRALMRLTTITLGFLSTMMGYLAFFLIPYYKPSKRGELANKDTGSLGN